VLFLQIKQAEVALADGRLDEAFRLIATSQPLRNHRRGQAIVTELVAQLVERGKAHLAANRIVEALADCEKAQQLGGNVEQAIALRAEIEKLMLESDRTRRTEARAGAVQTATALVDSAIGRQDLDRAVAELVRAKGNGCSDHRLRELDGNVRSTLQSQIEESLNEGRLEQIDLLMDRFTRLDPEALAAQRFTRAVDQAHQAWTAIESGDPSEAREILHRLAVQLPDAKWIKDSLEHLESAEQALRSLRTGPLGLLAVHSRGTGFQPVSYSLSHGLEARATGDTGAQLPMKFVIQVDGAGSYLVLRQPSVTLGPISSARVPDVALIAEPTAQTITVQRIEDDYFLKTEPAVGSQGKLLASGDRISLSPRCRLAFAIPNPSSTSATLELASGRFPRADLKKVILMDRDLIIGPGNSSHIRVDSLAQPLVIHLRNGQLWGRTTQIVMDSPTTIDGVNVAVTMG
jgi:tetratricopeptide (TPR) repeat protein